MHSSRGRFQGERVLLALGAWSPLLGQTLGLRLPMQPGKGYSLTYSRPAQVPRHALALREASVCVTTWNAGFRLGSTMEFCGYREGLNPRRLEALRRGAAEGLREPKGPQLQEAWWGWAADERGRGADHRTQHALVEPAAGHRARHAGR